MSTVNQLLAKAMSTSSDDEAIACLKMARKKGTSLELESGSVEYKGQNAKYWYDKAVSYYNTAKKLQDSGGLTQEQQKILYNMYTLAENEKSKLQTSFLKLKLENKKLQAKLDHKQSEYIAGVFFGIMLSIMPAVIFAVIL
jgi:hypothetical protein